MYLHPIVLGRRYFNRSTGAHLVVVLADQGELDVERGHCAQCFVDLLDFGLFEVIA